MSEARARRFPSLDEAWVKVLALFFMSLDHVGIFLIAYAASTTFGADPLFTAGYVLRAAGRIAFPLFALMLAEGVRHSRSVPRYLLRLSGMMVLVMLFQVIVFYFLDASIAGAQSPFVDLVLVGLSLYLFRRRDRLSWLAILPVSYILLATGVQIYEHASGYSVLWLPFYLRPGYSLLGLLTGVVFYYAPDVARRILEASLGSKLPEGELDEAPALERQLRVITNIVGITGLFALNVIVYLLAFSPALAVYGTFETWSIFAALVIIFYSGRRGYDEGWFRYGAYFYFPAHLAIIWAIFYIIFIT